MASAGQSGVKYTFFWKKNSPFSQWHLAKFTVNGVLYNCAEQFMMHQKAVLFGDNEVAEAIIKAEDPKKQKSLGRKVKNFDEDVWSANCEDIVKQGNNAKFSQNRHLHAALMETEGTTLAEASPVDCVWGIGLPADHPKAQSESTWRGRNLLGHILTQVREDLARQEQRNTAATS